MLTNRRVFFHKFLRDPGRIGAFAPATLQLAQKVSKATQQAYRNHPAVPGKQGLPFRLVELGAGTGALTQSINGLNPILVERDAEWAAVLRRRFPALEVRTQCATSTLLGLKEPVGIVTSIPLLNNPHGIELKRLLASKYADGLIRFCVLYTYGWTDPLKDVGFRVGYRSSFVVLNFPPASVWIYQ